MHPSLGEREARRAERCGVFAVEGGWLSSGRVGMVRLSCGLRVRKQETGGWL